jgi:hypothetical protein
MSKTGKLTIFQTKSRVNETLIIERSGSNPPIEATNDLQSRGFVDGDDPVTIIGADDVWQGEPAIDMTDAISGVGGETLNFDVSRRVEAKKTSGSQEGTSKKPFVSKKSCGA